MNVSTIVLSGGGVKGICYCGFFKYIEEHNLHKDLKTICGVSIGSLIALMHILKYTSGEIEEEIMSKNFKTLKHIQPINIFTSFGIDSGEHLMLWIESQIIKRGLPINLTFKELYEWNPILFKVGVTNLTNHQFEIFDKDSKPDLEIRKAIRISISIPLVYEYCKLDDYIYVDGGVLNNYPIEFFDNDKGVIGVTLQSSETGKRHDIESLDNYIYNVMQCILNRNSNKSSFHLSRTIEIQTDESIINFNLSKSKKKKLIDIGYKSTEKFFQKNKVIL